MRHLTYLGLLAGCLAGVAPLELWLGTRVLARPGRWLLAVLPTFVLFTGWDLYAISRHQWSYRRDWTSGVVLPGRLPLEEALFFLVVPTCAILAFEAVRAVRGWPAGDEFEPAPAPASAPGERQAPEPGQAPEPAGGTGAGPEPEGDSR